MEVDDDQQIDEYHGQHQAFEQPLERSPHGRDLTPDEHLRSARQILAVLIHDAIDVARHAAQVPILNGTKDIDCPLNVVVRDDGHPRAAARACDVAQDLRPAPGLP